MNASEMHDLCVSTNAKLHKLLRQVKSGAINKAWGACDEFQRKATPEAIIVALCDARAQGHAKAMAEARAFVEREREAALLRYRQERGSYHEGWSDGLDALSQGLGQLVEKERNG